MTADMFAPGTTRRTLLGLLAAGGLGTAVGAHPPSRIRAFAFDAFVLFDPRAVVERARELVGDHAESLVSTASAKLFAYSWYATSAGRYKPLGELARNAFQDSARTHDLGLDQAAVAHIVESYSNLPMWPDVPEALAELTSAGIKLAMLSNLSEAALRANLRAGGVEDQFAFVLSTDRARKFKPAAAAYELGVRAFGLAPARIGFAASAAWDAGGATWFGYPTVWVNRARLAAEEAYLRPSLISSGMDGVVELARR